MLNMERVRERKTGPGCKSRILKWCKILSINCPPAGFEVAPCFSNLVCVGTWVWGLHILHVAGEGSARRLSSSASGGGGWDSWKSILVCSML